MTKRCIVSFALISFLAACAPSTPPVDLEGARKGILDADKAWSKAVTDAARFASFFAPDGAIYPDDAPIQQGSAAIQAFADKLLQTPGLSVTWAATKADVAGSGDMGYSTGTYEMTMNDAAGKPMKVQGKYVTVWKKQPDGSWKVVADIFNPNGPPASATSE